MSGNEVQEVIRKERRHEVFFPLEPNEPTKGIIMSGEFISVPSDKRSRAVEKSGESEWNEHPLAAVSPLESTRKARQA